MSRKSLKKIISYLAVVPAIWPPPTIGIDHFDLDYLMGQQLGWLKWPTFLGLVFAALSFAISALYIVRYTQGFYKERRIPRSWKFILWGIFVTGIAEIGEMLGFYEWPYSGMAEMTLLVWPHAIGGALIGLGSYYLYKEVR
jgi:hypothetical protein